MCVLNELELLQTIKHLPHMQGAQMPFCVYCNDVASLRYVLKGDIDVLEQLLMKDIVDINAFERSFCFMGFLVTFLKYSFESLLFKCALIYRSLGSCFRGKIICKSRIGRILTVWQIRCLFRVETCAK